MNLKDIFEEANNKFLQDHAEEFEKYIPKQVIISEVDVYKGAIKFNDECFSRLLEICPEMAPLEGKIENEFGHTEVWNTEFVNALSKSILKNVDLLFNKLDEIIICSDYEPNSGISGKTVYIEFRKGPYRFTDVCNFEDTQDGRITRVDGDSLISLNDKYAIIKLNKSAKHKHESESIFNWGEYLCIEANSDIWIGTKAIPQHDTEHYPSMVNVESRCEFNTFRHGNTLLVEGDCNIVAETPIICNDNITIKGTPGSRLTLWSRNLQPCIGPKTRTGMSYGRWSPEGRCPSEIIIDGIEVICNSGVEAFSIGKYGDASNGIPKVTLLNGGKLVCPEMQGERVISYQAEAPSGSTKISEAMEYKIL